MKINTGVIDFFVGGTFTLDYSLSCIWIHDQLVHMAVGWGGDQQGSDNFCN